MKNLRLKAKVEAVNTAHEYALKLHPLLAAALNPFVGHKVIKVDGTLLDKVEKCLPEATCTPGLAENLSIRVWFHRSRYSIAWGVGASALFDYPDGHGQGF